MSLIKKCDVKNHLGARRHKTCHLSLSCSLPDATGFSGINSVANDALRSPFSRDFVHEHSASSKVPAPKHQPTAVADADAHRFTKSARL